MKIKSSLIAVIISSSLSLSAQIADPKSSSPSTEDIQLEKTSKPIVHSDYAGMEKKLVKALKSNIIPDNLPKYLKGQSLESYKLILKEWSKKNISLFTDEYKAKLKAKKKK